jgi:hypothetical protein
MAALSREGQTHTRTVKFDGAMQEIDLLSESHSVKRRYSSEDAWGCFAVHQTHLCFIHSSDKAVYVTVSGHDPAQLDQALAEITERFDEVVQSDPRMRVTVWSSGEPTVRALDAPAWDEVSENYPAGVSARLGELMKLTLRAADARLIIWQGPPGTGKTSAARALIRSWSPWCDTHYVVDPDDLLSRGYYLRRFTEWNNVAATGRPKLVILEDVDEVLRDYGREKAQARLRALLNLSDGLFPDLGLIFLATTNLPIAEFDEALTRPGRCLAVTEFRPFTANEARDWLGGAASCEARDHSLAELFTIRDHAPHHVEKRPTAVGLYL